MISRRAVLLSACVLPALGVVFAAVQPKRADAVKRTAPRVALQRFEVVSGKEARFAEWMEYLRQNREEAVETLDAERMYFESVHSEVVAGVTYAYWLTFSDEGGRPVEKSDRELDRIHLAYWRECIRRGSGRVIETEFHLTPRFVDAAIDAHRTSARP